MIREFSQDLSLQNNRIKAISRIGQNIQENIEMQQTLSFTWATVGKCPAFVSAISTSLQDITSMNGASCPIILTTSRCGKTLAFIQTALFVPFTTCNRAFVLVLACTVQTPTACHFPYFGNCKVKKPIFYKIVN